MLQREKFRQPGRPKGSQDSEPRRKFVRDYRYSDPEAAGDLCAREKDDLWLTAGELSDFMDPFHEDWPHW